VLRPWEASGLRRLAGDGAFNQACRDAKREAKTRFVDWLKATAGITADPDTIFDSQIKRIHEYKRQLLNALHIVVLYNRLRDKPDLEIAPRTSFRGQGGALLRLPSSSSSSSTTSRLS
jgi:starch phosphorylase